jgi:ribonuclease HI
MELTAMLKVLELIPYKDPGVAKAIVTVHSDSKYVLQGLVKDGNGQVTRPCKLGTKTPVPATLTNLPLTGWVVGWTKNGWQTKDRKPVVNRQLWEAIATQVCKLVNAGINVSFKHVRGHTGVEGNELVDRLAKGLTIR